MSEITLPRSSAAAVPAEHTMPLWQKAALAIAGTVLVAICARVSIPLFFTPVPLSLAPFPVFFLGLVLGPRLGFATLALYLLEGASGLPVFSPHGPGGLLQLVGPTGGYLLSYPFAAALAGYLYQRSSRRFSAAVVGAAAASLLILVTGAAWLAVLTHASARVILTEAVFPFLPGDVLKICAAAGAATLIASRVRARQSKTGTV